MDAAFTSIAFADPPRAEANLQRIEQRLPGNVWPALPSLLAQVPDPDGALNFLERYLREAPTSVLGELGRRPASLHSLLVVFGYSRFLSETLIQQPELLLWLHRPGSRDALERLKSPEDLNEEFARFEATSFDLPAAVILARFKRREYLRIMLRDVLGLATLAETTLELSHLADALLDRALRIAHQRLQNAYGAPQYTDEAGRRHRVELAMISLGKLGAQELNYNSDIDFMFLYGRDGETAGGPSGSITNAEYFVRLAQTILKMISEVTSEGAVYRVDLRLRPQGSEGDLAVSLATALDYYRRRAREWELQMLIKARGSAGDTNLARRFLREVQPLIYRREFDLAAVEAVLNAREEITRELRRRPRRFEEQWNVKLTPGGIRDIEFLTQCLQRLYGGSDPWLAGGAASTLVALQRLHDKGYLTGRDFFRLSTAYQFLRRVEHRLQLRDGLQRHTLPEAADALERLARRCGVEPAPAEGRSASQQLLHRIQQHFGEVRAIYQRILARPDASAPASMAEEADAPAGMLLRRLRREYPAIADAVTRYAATDADTHGRRGLDRFLSSAVLHPEVLTTLREHPEWVASAGEAFARSDYLLEMLTRYPHEVVLVADAAQAPPTEVPPTGAADKLEEALSALRRRYRQRLVATVARAVRGIGNPFETFATLTELAEQALRGVLALSAGETCLATGYERLEDAPFTVIALGRLGSGEMDVASDADLVFVTDESLPPERREPWRKLAERFVHVVSSHTGEGLLFPVDARLRPRGGEGDLVQSVAYLRDYFTTEAQGWEAATFLKARPVAGNPALGARVIGDVHAVLVERFADPAALAARLVHTRQRLETEGAGPRAKGEFKKVAGGFYDLDYMLAFLFLTRRVPPGGHVLRQIAALESAQALDAARAQTLRAAAMLYRCLDHALRLITGHAANHLPEPALAARVASLLRPWGIALPAHTEPAEAIAALVRATQEQLRSLYQEIVASLVTTPQE